MSIQTSSAAWADNSRPGAGVRIYRGRNLIDLIPRIRADLGPDAVIVRERQGVVGGINGFFAKRFVEVEAQAAPRVDVYDDEDDLSFADDLADAEVGTEAIIAAEEQRLALAERAVGTGATALTETPVEPEAVMEYLAAVEPQGPVEAQVAVEPQVPAAPQAPTEDQAGVEPEALGKPPEDVSRSGISPPPAAATPQPAAGPEPAIASQPAAGARAPVASHLAAAPQPSVVPQAPAAAQPAPAPQPPLVPRPAAARRAPFEPPAAYDPQPEVEGGYLTEPEFEIESGAPTGVADPLGRNLPARLEPLPPPRTKKKSMRGGRAASIARQRTLRDGDVGREAWIGVARELSGRGMTEVEAERLSMEAAAHGIPLARASALRDSVREMLARQLMRSPTLPAGGAAVAFVGAGGAGKTRCAAALASAYRRASTLSVMALTLGDADDRRTIETLLETEGVPVKAATEVRSLPRLVSDVRAGGVVVVDTPAIAPGDRAAVLSLAEALEPLKLEGVFVAVPATIGPQAARQLLAGLQPLRPTGIAVTHLDETDQLGIAVELACATGTPIAYVHEGLDIRRALSAPDPVQLATRLLP